MPIYAYKCESCGFAKDVLQKISDAPLQDCPTCNQPTFKKQLTAAGFQLKGSGWYATDFKSNGSAPTAAAAPADASKPAAETSAPADSKPDSKPAPAATPATPPAASSS